MLNLMSSNVDGTKCKIKASGGIKTYKQALEFINLGCSRIGRSRGKEICNDFKPD